MENQKPHSLYQSKQNKKYQLVVSLSEYGNKEQLKKNPQFKQVMSMYSNTNHLPKIIDIDEGKYNHNHEHLQNTMISNNIFQINSSKKSQIDFQGLSLLKQYQIVGVKQINSYKNKLLSKRKNALVKRADSMLSLSRISSSIKSQKQGKYFNKDDLLNIVVNQKNQRQLSFFNQTQQTHKTNYTIPKFGQNENTAKVPKDKYQSYVKIWNEQKQKKQKFPSVLDRIDHFRKKIERLQVFTLNQKKQSIDERIWRTTLRTDKNAQTFYNDKYIQKILHTGQGLSLKGKQKLQKQIQWVQQKDKNGCLFVFVYAGLGKCLKINKSITSDKQKQKNIEKDSHQINKFNTTHNSNQFKKQRGIFKSIINNPLNLQSSKISKIYSPSQFSHYPNLVNQMKSNGNSKNIREIKTQQVSERKKEKRMV